MSDLDQLDDLDLLDDDLAFDDDPIAPVVPPSAPPSPMQNKPSIAMIRDIPVEVTVEVSRRSLALKELMAIEPSSVIMLDKHEGEPVDIKINGVLFGTGNIIAQNGKYGVQVLALVDSDPHQP